MSQQFLSCDCDRCQQMSKVLEALLPMMKEAIKQSINIDSASGVTSVLNLMVLILENLFSGERRKAKMAASYVSALNDFVHCEVNTDLFTEKALDAFITTLGDMGVAALAGDDVEDFMDTMSDKLKMKHNIH